MVARRGLLYLLAVLLPAFTVGPPESGSQFKLVNPATLRFAAAPNLPECAKFSLLRGDPAKGASVTLARWSAGCTVPKHWHTANLELIMVSGRMRLETEGNKVLQPGGYVFLPSHHHHQFPCATACMFYLISDGAFDIHYVDREGKEISVEQALHRF